MHYKVKLLKCFFKEESLKLVTLMVIRLNVLNLRISN